MAERIYSNDQMFSEGNKLYFGTIEEDVIGNSFTLRGVVIKEGMCPKAILPFYESEDADDTTITVDEMRKKWKDTQAGVMLIPSDSPFPRIGSVVMFKNGERRGYRTEINLDANEDTIF